MPAPLHVETDETSTQHLKVSLFKHLGAINKIQKCMENKSPGQTDMPAASLCNMCCRKDDVCVNLQNNHATVLTVSDITRLPSWDIRQILASVCSRCLVYISAITESSSKLRMRCEQAMHSQNIVLAPPTPDTSPNNFLQVSKSLLDDTPGHSNSEQRNCYGPAYCDDTPNDMSLPLTSSFPPHSSSALPKTFQNSIFETLSRSPSPCNAGQNSMLKIHYEQPVSPLNTESGGGGKNRKRSYQRVQVIPVQLTCTHCNRAYWRKDFYRKHMRRCSAKVRYAKSMISQRSRSRSCLELDTISVMSEGNEQIASQQIKTRTFRCNVCIFTADNITELKQHKQVHLPRHVCDICSNEFTSQNEYEFHRAQCVAKMEVFQKALSDAKNEANVMPMRRKTRSFSRAQSVAPSVCSTKATPTKKSKMPAKKMEALNKKLHKSNYNEDEKSNLTNYVKRHKSLYGDHSSNNDSDLNEGGVGEQDDEDDDDNDDDVEDEDDDMSEADTLYSKRMSLTNHWVEEHSLSSNSHTSQHEVYVNEFMEDVGFATPKEYDLYLLERLKIEVRLSIITCYVPGCRFTCATLNEMMVHDYIYHYKKPWFSCQKCGHCFTSKVFLDYHLDMQNRGRYVCYICGGNFEYQNQLDRHLIQHNRIANNGGEKYICHFCNLRFLDEDKLFNHCNYENHDWSEKRQTIEIDHSMTIANKVMQKRKNEDETKYQVKILKMVLKPLPTKRSTPMEKYRFHLPPHLRIPKRIGQVNFPYPSNPNCVGCL